MKTKSKLLLILFLIVTLLVSTTVFATDTTVDDEANTDAEAISADEADVITEADETTEEILETDKFFAGDSIEISELIDGNVYAIGKDIKVTGKIAGDLFVIAETLTMDVEAEIYGNVFAIASKIEINGAMYDTYLVCDEFIYGYDGYAQRDLRVMASTVSLNGRVVRDSYIEADKLTIETDFLAGGNLTYTAQSEAVYIETTDDGINDTTEIPSSVIPGEIKYTPRSQKLFSEEVKKSVDSIIKSNDINNDTSDEKVKAIFTSYVFNAMGVKTNSEGIKDGANTITMSKVTLYVGVIVIVVLVIVLVIALVLSILSNKPSVVKEPKEKKEENKEN